MGGKGFKRYQGIKKREKSRNFNKEQGGKNCSKNISDYKWGSGYDQFGFKQYVYDEYGIKFASKQSLFETMTCENGANIPQSDIEILLHNGIMDDYWKVSPMDWEHHHDRTKWKTNKNKSNGRMCDRDSKFDI